MTITFTFREARNFVDRSAIQATKWGCVVHQTPQTVDLIAISKNPPYAISNHCFKLLARLNRCNPRLSPFAIILSLWREALACLLVKAARRDNDEVLEGRIVEVHSEQVRSANTAEGPKDGTSSVSCAVAIR